jgi:hypothetical protein
MAFKPVTYDPKTDKVNHLKSSIYKIEDIQNRIDTDIFGPMAFWIFMLAVGLIIEFAGVPIAKLVGAPTSGIITVANYLLYLPGAIVLPLVVAVWVGERVGSVGKKVRLSLKVGLLNAIYVALIYSIVIFIIYLIIYYIDAKALPVGFTIDSFITNLIAIPVIIVLVLTPLISSVSAARHS